MTVILRPRWTPRRLTGLKLWLGASQITGLADGDPVATWPDLSGQANHATQATGSKRPTYKTGIINGLPVVRFDGVDDFLACGTHIDLSGACTAIAVAMFTGVAATQAVFSDYNAAGTVAQIVTTVTSAAKNRVLHANGGSMDAVGSASLTAATYYALTWTRSSGADPFGYAAYRNGAAESLTASGTSAVPSASFGSTTIGRAGDFSGQYLGGDMAEVIVLNRAFSTAERQKTERYLGQKYALAVA